MSISVENKDNYQLVIVENEKLDSIVAPDLKAQFVLSDSEGAERIVIDLSNCKYCDSSGLSALLVGNRLFKEKGGIAIFGLQPNVNKLIEISQLHNVLNIAEEEASAANLLKN